MMIIVDDLLVLDARLSGCVRVREFTHTLRSAASRVSVSKLIKISTERERDCVQSGKSPPHKHSPDRFNLPWLNAN